MPNGKNYNNKNTYYMDLSMVSERLAQVRKRLTTDLTDGTFILHSVLTANNAVQEIPAESKLSLDANSSLPGGRLALERVNVDRAQPAHSQHFHRKRAVDPVAIQDADQVVDAVDVDAVEFDDDIAG
jgi:hypothetical protein